nr:hypothetical protein [Leptolyngbya sp. Prado105]
VISNNQTLSQPTLQAISAEQYKGIPGAEVTFPKAGIYTLEISGKPKVDPDEFNAFKFAYDVTVQAGTSAQSTPAAVTHQPTVNATDWLLPTTSGAIAVLTCAWIVKRTLRK